MALRNINRWHVAAVLGSTVSALFAGDFAPPAEGPVAFRRDRLSLDAGMMSHLSRQLVVLGEGVGTGTAEDRRTVARMLALATALDPGNTRARNLISTLKRAQNPARPTEGEQIVASQAGVWDLLGWLEKPEAGADANALAACLLDVISVSDPKHPRSVSLREAPERGAWKGWIPPLAAYEAQAPAPPPDPGNLIPTVPQSTGILLEKATVATILWTCENQSETVKSWHLTSAPLEMTATAVTDANSRKPFSLTIGPPPGSPVTAPLVPPLLRALEKIHGKLPAGGQVTITSDALTGSLLSKKRQSISAAAAVLASAALSGKEPDAIIIGLVDQTGGFRMPTGFWAQLQALGPGTGRKLIVPAEAADFLPSMLALEKPEFFFDHEVLLAGNFRELLDMSAKEPPEAIAKASAAFREIRAKATGQSLRQYIANPFVRRRLGEVAQEAPYLVSAKMLSIQGSGNRPALISRAVLCAEIKHVLEPIGALRAPDATSETVDMTDSPFGALFESCKSQIDQLFRYADKPDRDLIERAEAVIATLRMLDRATRGRGGSNYIEVATAFAAMNRSYTALLQTLAVETGEAESPPSS